MCLKWKKKKEFLIYLRNFTPDFEVLKPWPTNVKVTLPKSLSKRELFFNTRFTF